MFRKLMLSTVFRNVPDQGGGAPAAKPDDSAVAAAAPAFAADGAPAAAAVDPAAAPAAPADGGAAAPAADGAGDLAAAAPAAAEAPKPADKDFKAETLLTGEEPKPGDAPKAAPTDGDKPAEDKAGAPGEDGAKPAEGAKEGDKAPDAPPAPVVAPVYEYEFPDGIKLEPDVLKPVNEVFAKHGVTPEAAKEFMGMHVQALQTYANEMQAKTAEEQRDVWARTRGMWREEIQSDEHLGGAGYQTTLAQSAEVRDRLVPKERMAAFNRMLLVTGVGDHPEFIRLMKSAHRFVGEGSVPAQQGNPSPNNGQPGGRRRLRDTYAKPA